MKFSRIFVNLLFWPSAVFADVDLSKYVNAEARPVVRKSWEAINEIAFLYWWTGEDDLAFATTQTREKNPRMRPDIGFKLNVGAFLPHDGWDFITKLTHLHSRAPVHASGGGLAPQWTLNNAPGFVDAVHGHWRLHFAFVDFELGRSYWVSDFLQLRPHVGVRYAIVRQKYLIHYQGGDLFPGGESYVSMKNKFLAPGLRAGLELDWKLYCGFSLYSNMAFSLLFGNVYVHQAEKVSFEQNKRFDIFRKFRMQKPILDLGGGVQWETSLCRNAARLQLQAGWEQHLLFAQNQFFHFPAQSISALSSVHGVLSLQGLVLAANFFY